MIWLTWRQFRVQAVAVYAAVAALAVVLAITAPDLPDTGASLYDQLTRLERNLFYAGLVVVAVAPAIIGAFWGAPMVARELEAGTHRLVWNQTVTRTRWLATKLGLTATATVAAVGVLTLAVSWWSDPIDGALSETRGALPSRLTPVAFAMRGIAPVGYAVFALVLGVAAGIVLRRTVPAMAVALVLFTFVQIAMPLWVRPHLVPPVRQDVEISEANLDSIGIRGPGEQLVLTVTTGMPGDWVLSDQTVDATGRVGVPSWFADCVPPPPSPGSAGPVPAKPDLQACFGRLTAEGYRQHVAYQPASRFWALQWVETGLFLAVSALLAWFCFWWTRRRLS